MLSGSLQTGMEVTRTNAQPAGPSAATVQDPLSALRFLDALLPLGGTYDFPPLTEVSAGDDLCPPPLLSIDLGACTPFEVEDEPAGRRLRCPSVSAPDLRALDPELWCWAPPMKEEEPIERPGQTNRVARAYSCPSPVSAAAESFSAPATPGLAPRAAPAPAPAPVAGGIATLLTNLPMPSLRPIPLPVVRGAGSFSAPTSPLMRGSLEFGPATLPAMAPMALPTRASPEPSKLRPIAAAPRRPAINRSLSAPSLGDLAEWSAAGPPPPPPHHARPNSTRAATPVIDEDSELDCNGDLPPGLARPKPESIAEGNEASDSAPTLRPPSAHLAGLPFVDTTLRYNDGTVWSRSEALRRYREKRRRRNFHRGITYAVRKEAASKRLRVSGRFVPKGQEMAFRMALQAVAVAGVPLPLAPRAR